MSITPAWLSRGGKEAAEMGWAAYFKPEFTYKLSNSFNLDWTEGPREERSL